MYKQGGIILDLNVPVPAFPERLTTTILFVLCGRVMGIPCEIITPKQVAQLHPLINIHDLVGALYMPEDAVVSSADVSLALANAASRNGMNF